MQRIKSIAKTESAKSEVKTKVKELKKTEPKEQKENEPKENEPKENEPKEQKENEELNPGAVTAVMAVMAVTATNVDTAVNIPLITTIITPIIKRKAIPKAVKSTLWNIHFTENNAKGECTVCNKEIKITDFDAGHIIAASNGGSDNLDNLMPVCSLCNKSMGVQNMNEFKKLYF